MTKAKRKKKKTKSNGPKRTGVGDGYRWATFGNIAQELGDLAAGLDYLPELRQMARVMRDIEHPPPTTATLGNMIFIRDEIGRAAIQHYGVALDEKLSPPGLRFIDGAMNAGSLDLTNASASIAASVQWRLYRLEAFIRLLKEEEAKAWQT